MRIRWRLALLGTGLALLAVLLFGVLLLVVAASDLTKQQDALLDTLARRSAGQFTADAGHAALTLDPTLVTDPFVVVTDADGQILHSQAEIGGVAPEVPAAVVLDAQRTGTSRATLTVDGVELRMVARPWSGGVVVAMQPTRASTPVVEGLTAGFFLAVLVTAVAAAVASWVVSGRALRPLRVLAATAGDVARTGDLGTRLPVTRPRDDVAALARDFNAMMDRLQGSQAALAASLLAGQDPGQVQGETSEQLEARCNGDGALDRYTDCRLIKVVSVANEVWADELERRGLSFRAPKLAFFSGQTDTACGAASAQVGPFYCPGDEEIYFELAFLDQLQEQFGAQGTFAQGYIAAHEYGHHLQTVLGTEPKVRAAQQRDPENANKYSVALELQADCYAGVWATLADKQSKNGIDLSEENIAEAVNAAQAVGDDRIQQKVQGRVDPESWTHGSAEQRRTWFLTGYRSGDIDTCNTFG